MNNVLNCTVINYTPEITVSDVECVSRSSGKTTIMTHNDRNGAISYDVEESPEYITSKLLSMIKLSDAPIWFNSKKVRNIVDKEDTGGRTVIILQGGGTILTDDTEESLRTKMDIELK